jgi:hypothetical protein
MKTRPERRRAPTTVTARVGARQGKLKQHTDRIIRVLREQVKAARRGPKPDMS